MTSRPFKPSGASSSQLLSSRPSGAATSSVVRPRNRRLISAQDEADSTHDQAQGGDDLLSAFESPAADHQSNVNRSGVKAGPAADNGTVGQFLEESISQSWLSMQGFASSLLAVGDGKGKGSRYSSRSPNGRFRPTVPSRRRSNSAKSVAAWGPEPPSQRLGLGDVATGSLAEREAALKAARTASVLESHDNVNGGLDVIGKHKRRNSDVTAPDGPQDEEECLVYIHKVQPGDTYVGVILKYKCREDAFRKANGLWSRDSVLTRKWLTIPVDACEVRGRPCEGPSWSNSQGVDLLAPTPAAGEERDPGGTSNDDDFFSYKPRDSRPSEDQSQPWAHVRWVTIDSVREPIEIARISRQALGYFPPRRKKSIASALSTPRQSSDLSAVAPGSAEQSFTRRLSSLGSWAQPLATPGSDRSRVDSGAADFRPTWMRRPGGVGSMGANVRAPGPDKDTLDSWTKKHFPALNSDNIPSMSIMGSETLRFGFGTDSSAIVESPFEDGRDMTSASRQGTGLDRAAAAVETWLRGALAKAPSTPLLGARRGGGSSATNPDNDLIELTDAASDDGRLMTFDTNNSLLDGAGIGTTARRNNGLVKARNVGGRGGKKDD